MERFLLDIALAEFTSLRNEILMKMKMLYQIYLIYFAALGVFYVYILNNETYDFVMIIPWMSLALFFRLFYDQQMMNLIDRYIQNELVPKQLLPLLTAGEAEESPQGQAIMQWLRFYLDNQPFRYYKLSFFLVFVFLSVGPSLYYNASNLFPENLQISQFTIASSFPPIYHSIFAALNLCIGFGITLMILKIDRNKA